MKTVLITGANKGIGLETARQLGHKDFHICLAARNAERGEAATESLRQEGILADFVQMDVASAESVQAAFEQVHPKVENLDVLINNAGVLLPQDKDLLDMPQEVIEQTWQINAMGPLLVARTFAAVLRSGSRIINISSGGGAICEGVSTWAPAYCISKTTLNAVTLQLAEALEHKGILVNAVCPGWVRTDMGGGGAGRPVSKGAETPVWMATSSRFKSTGKFWRDKKEISW